MWNFVHGVIIAAVYVASLYAWAFKYPRETLFGSEAESVRRRFVSVVASAVLSVMYVVYGLGIDIRVLGIWTPNSPHFLVSSVSTLLLTMLFFLGPLIQWIFLSGSELFEDTTPWSIRIGRMLRDVHFLRHMVVAPITEEIVYRCCLCAIFYADIPLAQRTSAQALPAILFVAVIFSLSHAHHVLERKPNGERLNPLGQVLFQLGFTSIFGAYSTFLFLRTGHVAAPLLSHIFCNWMGVPDFAAVARFQKRSRLVIIGAYLLGIVGFCVLVGPLTSPFPTGSLYWMP